MTLPKGAGWTRKRNPYIQKIHRWRALDTNYVYNGPLDQKKLGRITGVGSNFMT